MAITLIPLLLLLLSIKIESVFLSTLFFIVIIIRSMFRESIDKLLSSMLGFEVISAKVIDEHKYNLTRGFG